MESVPEAGLLWEAHTHLVEDRYLSSYRIPGSSTCRGSVLMAESCLFIAIVKITDYLMTKAFAPESPHLKDNLSFLSLE